MKSYVMDEHGELHGAYWANILVDRKGNLIEMLSNEGDDPCYPLRFLLNPERRYPRLRQNLDTKICVIQ
jgi:hypothetical protein